MAAMSSERVQKYTQQLSDTYVQSIKNGSIPLIHPKWHEFVNRTHDSNKSIYVRKYMPEKQRASESQISFTASHLDAEPYQKVSLEMRSEEVWKQKSPIRYGLRTENERVKQQIDPSIDHTSKDMKMYHFPNWKPTQRQRWLAKQTFVSAPANFTSKSAWKEIPHRNKDDNYIYIDQVDDFKQDDHKKQPFIGQIKPNPYVSMSQSIRTFKQDIALGIVDKEVYSSNNTLKNYKEALIKTKSMDHIIPYNHSNNYQSVKNLLPRPQKNYLKSIPNEEIQIKIQESNRNSKPLDSINEYPKTSDKNNKNFEKTSIFFPQEKFRHYDDSEAKQIVDKYFK
ncbi:hypothetical protein pb186bvf_017614 [Paramecium bursaria]